MSARHGAVALVVAAALALVGCGGFGEETPAAPPSKAVQSYVALGDGFAAAPYLGDDTSGNGCLRSPGNYPAQVAKALGVTDLKDVSCTLATTSALTGKSSAPGAKAKNIPAQFDAVDASTDLITLGIGVQDNGLLLDMFHICAATPCGDDVLAPEMFEKLDDFAATLTANIRTLQDKAPNARIVVVGYPQIMPATGLCDALPEVTDTQLGYAHRVLQRVNGTLLSSAQQTGATFVDTAQLSVDHHACSDDPWVGSYRTAAGRYQPFRPDANEQAAVASEIVRLVRGSSAGR